MLTYCQWKQKELKMSIFYSVILFFLSVSEYTDGKPGMEVGRMGHVDEDVCTAGKFIGDKLDM